MTKKSYSLWSLEEFNEILKAPVRTKMPSFDKVMHWLKTLIFTYLRFIKAVASDQHNYANNITMIKGVHQLTLRPNTLISLVDHFTIFNGWKDGWTDPCADPGFLSVEGVQARRPAYRNRTEQNIYFIDLNSTVSRHTYFDITKDFYKVTINVYMDLTTKL